MPARDSRRPSNCLMYLSIVIWLFSASNFIDVTKAQNAKAATCACDLTQNSCDPNCCCDADCTTADQNAFIFCKNVDLNQDDRVCVSDQVIEISNVKYRTSGTGDGLFCIYTDNYAARNFYRTVQSATTISRFNELLQSYGKTSYNTPSQKMPEYISRSFYKYGDPILLLFESNVHGFLAFPKPSVGTSQCDDRNPAGFMKEETSKCTRFVTDLPSQCINEKSLDASTYYAQFKFLPGPYFLATGLSYQQVNKTINASVIRPFTSTISPSPSSPIASAFRSPVSGGPSISTTINTVFTIRFYNDSGLVNATLMQPIVCLSTTGVKGSCSFATPPKPVYNFSENVCKNVIKKVTYTILYDGNSTSLDVSSVMVNLVMGGVASSASYFSQEFAIGFQKVGSATSFTRSGNPGYVTGLAVVAGTLQVNAQLKKEVIILNKDPTKWLTVLKPSSATSNDCGSSSERTSVRFGINMRTGCFVSIKRSMTTNECVVLQNNIYSSLLGTLPTHVAMYGNSPVTNTADWVKILNTRPQVTPVSDNGKCRSMILGVQFEVLHSMTGYFGNPQSRIIGFNVKYDFAKELTFTCSGRYCQPGSSSLQTQQKEVTQSVSFVDVSTTPEAQMKPKPTFEAKAPYEFFYPFV